MGKKQHSHYSQSAADEAKSLLKQCGVDMNETVKEGSSTKFVYQGYHYFQTDAEAQKLLLLATLNKMTKQLEIKREAQ